MKFTNQQQKWALTTSLLLVLGFSFSMHFSPKSGPEYAQLGAAHEQIEPVMMAKNYGEEKVVHLSSESVVKTVTLKSPEVDLRKKTEASATPLDGSLKVTGQYQETKTQSTKDEDSKETKKEQSSITCQDFEKIANCPDCLQIKLVDIDKTSSFNSLAKAFFTAGLTKCKSQEEAKNNVASVKASTNAETIVLPAATTTTTAAASTEQKEKSEEDQHQAVFDKVKATCDKKSKDLRLDCNITEFVKLLKKDKVTYTKSVVESFFKENIEKPLKDDLSNLDDPNDQIAFEKNLREFSEKIKGMQNDIGKDYSYIREKLAHLSVNALANKALEINRYHHATQINMQSNNPYGARESMMAERMATNQLQLMSQYLPNANRNGLLSAVTSKLISRDYASSLYGSVDIYRNNLMSNIYNIASMSPLEAELSLNVGNWDLEGSRFNRFNLGSRFQRGYGNALLTSGRFGRGSSLFDREYGLSDFDSRFLGTRRGGRGRLSNFSRIGNSWSVRSSVFNRSGFNSGFDSFSNFNQSRLSTTGQFGRSLSYESRFLNNYELNQLNNRTSDLRTGRNIRSSLFSY